MKVSIYKLAEHKIIEYDTGELRWEAHFGLGALQEGRCFKKGTILFIGPAESQRDGFLKLEFIDHLKGFPEWLKTKYYCENLEVLHCKTGKKVSREEMRLWMLDRGLDEGDRRYSEKPGQRPTDITTRMAGGDVAFRLQRYEIIMKADGQIIWKTHAGANTVIGGNGVILENILFIGSSQNEEPHLTKRQFLARLQQLQKWDRTGYYCPEMSLRDCETGNRLQEERKRQPHVRRATERHDIGNGYNNTAESKILQREPRRLFPAGISAAFQSLVKPVTRRGESTRFSRFNFKKPDISKSMAVFRASGIRKWITCIVALIFLIISLFIVFLIGYRKEHHEGWHDKKREHSSTHHRDH